MSDFTVKVEGEKQVALALKKLLGFSQIEAKKLVANAGERIVGKAKEKTPVKTGNLRSSLTRLLSDAGMTVTVGSNIEYAPFVEYGTRKMIAAHGPHDPKSPVTSWAAQKERGASRQQMPFLTPVFLEQREVFIRAIRKLMNEASRKRY